MNPKQESSKQKSEEEEYIEGSRRVKKPKFIQPSPQNIEPSIKFVSPEMHAISKAFFDKVESGNIDLVRNDM